MENQDVQKMVDVLVDHEFKVAVQQFTNSPNAMAYDRLTRAMLARQYWMMCEARQRELDAQCIAPLTIGQWLPWLLKQADQE